MSGNLCEHCTGVCCKYIALPIDTPETKADFDDVRWYLLHENVSVFVEDGSWYINMATPCRHLQADNRCGIYATRPRICRKYTTDNCDYHSGDYGWEQHFTCPEHLDVYVTEKVSKSGNRKVRNGSSNTRGSEKSSKSKIHLNRKMPGPGSGVIGRDPAGARLAEARTDIAGVNLPVLGDGA
ncbi:MAG: YkgJ family cysteine cluster protein [Phycisphaerae bacterium]